MNSRWLRWTAFLFALFHIYCNVFASISELWLSAIHFGGFGAICMFMANEALSDGKRSPQYWINLGLALLAIASAGYLVLFENALYARETEYVLSDYVFSIIAIALAIEFTRRTTGWFMPILITLSLSYILFLGCSSFSYCILGTGGGHALIYLISLIYLIYSVTYLL